MLALEDWEKTPRFQQYVESLQSAVGALGLDYKEILLQYERGQYPFMIISTPNIKTGDKVLDISAGIHGDEIAGPLTFYYYLEEIVEFARGMGVGLRIRPCTNPYAFDFNTRYNPEEGGPNNYFLIYKKPKGGWTDDLRDSNEFVKWSIPSFVIYRNRLRLKKRKSLPVETKALRKEVLQLVENPPTGALDLHQDHLILEHHPELVGTYVYVFEKEPYLSIIKKTGETVRVLKNTHVEIDPHGAHGKMRTDEDGTVYWRDGSLGDLLDRLGVPFAATVETTGKTPLDRAIKVNKIWTEEFIKLIAAYNR